MGRKFGNRMGMGIISWTSWEWDWEWERTDGNGREWKCCKPFPHISMMKMQVVCERVFLAVQSSLFAYRVTFPSAVESEGPLFIVCSSAL